MTWCSTCRAPAPDVVWLTRRGIHRAPDHRLNPVSSALGRSERHSRPMGSWVDGSSRLGRRTTRRWSRSTRCCRRTCSTVDVAGASASELAYEIVVWIEHTYNRRRRQRALGKLTPVAFELAFTPPPCLEDTSRQHDQSQPPSTNRAADPSSRSPHGVTPIHLGRVVAQVNLPARSRSRRLLAPSRSGILAAREVRGK